MVAGSKLFICTCNNDWRMIGIEMIFFHQMQLSSQSSTFKKLLLQGARLGKLGTSSSSGKPSEAAYLTEHGSDENKIDSYIYILNI